jgi:hypothetical protein
MSGNGAKPLLPPFRVGGDAVKNDDASDASSGTCLCQGCGQRRSPSADAEITAVSRFALAYVTVVAVYVAALVAIYWNGRRALADRLIRCPNLGRMWWLGSQNSISKKW